MGAEDQLPPAGPYPANRVVRLPGRAVPQTSYMSRVRNVSWTSVDLPLPETPVTQVKRPRGMATSTFFRLFPDAPRRTSQSVPFEPDMWTEVYLITFRRGRPAA